MGALSLALPLTVFVYLLPSETNNPDFGKVATTIAEQVNSLVGNVAKEIDRGKDEIEFELIDDSSEVKPVILSPVNDTPKPIIGFQLKGEAEKHADATLQYDSKWSDYNGISSEERKTPKEILSKDELVKNLKIAFAEAGRKDTAASRVPIYVPIKDTMRKKIVAQLGSDVDGRGGGFPSRKKNYVLLCRKAAEDGSMQKLRGKDCVKLPRNEFYLEHSMKNRKDGTTSLMGLKIGAKTNGVKDFENGSDEIK